MIPCRYFVECTAYRRSGCVITVICYHSSFITHNKLCLAWQEKNYSKKRREEGGYSQSNRTRPNPIRSVETSTKKFPTRRRRSTAEASDRRQKTRKGDSQLTFNGLVIICCAQRSKIILTPWQYCCSFRLASLLVEKCARSCHCDFTLSPRFSRRRLLVCQPWPVSSLCSAWHYVILSMLGMCGLKKIQHESNVWRCIRIVLCIGLEILCDFLLLKIPWSRHFACSIRMSAMASFNFTEWVFSRTRKKCRIGRHDFWNRNSNKVVYFALGNGSEVLIVELKDAERRKLNFDTQVVSKIVGMYASYQMYWIGEGRRFQSTPLV